MRLRSIDFPVVCPDRSAAFQQLISNDIRNFAPRQLTDELDYGKCKTLCSRFKFFFQSIRFQFAIRNSPSAIRHPQFAIRNSMPSTLLQFAIRNSPSAIQCLRPFFNSPSAIRHPQFNAFDLLQSAIRNPQSAIQIISAKVFSVLRKYQMPRKRKRAITAIDAAKPGI
jgi:hypothetical protein